MRCGHSKCESLSFLFQEHQVGKEKLDVVQILQAHHVIVRGGPQEGNKLIKALLVSTCGVNPSLTEGKDYPCALAAGAMLKSLPEGQWVT